MSSIRVRGEEVRAHKECSGGPWRQAGCHRGRSGGGAWGHEVRSLRGRVEPWGLPVLRRGLREAV